MKRERVMNRLILLSFFASLSFGCSEASKPDVDTDGDGYTDKIDSFPLNPSEHLDSDGDGMTDRNDAFPLDPAEYVDTDGDGIGNNQDNCFLWPNPDQFDSNNDGIGNACANNDTGVSFRMTRTNAAEELPSTWQLDANCTDTGDYQALDCANGRDVEQEALNNKIGSGIGAFDFTKISISGAEMSADATEEDGWACTRDNVTGLIWEVKSNQATPDELDPVKNRRYLHYKEHLYAQYDSSLPYGDIIGTDDHLRANYNIIPDDFSPESLHCEITGLGLEEVIGLPSKCNQEEFIKRFNAAYENDGGLCGIENWRLPTIYELDSLVSYEAEVQQNEKRLLIDSQYFNLAQDSTRSKTFYLSSSLIMDRYLIEYLSNYEYEGGYNVAIQKRNYRARTRAFVENEDYSGNQSSLNSFSPGWGRHIMLVADFQKDDKR